MIIDGKALEALKTTPPRAAITEIDAAIKMLEREKITMQRSMVRSEAELFIMTRIGLYKTMDFLEYICVCKDGKEILKAVKDGSHVKMYMNGTTSEMENVDGILLKMDVFRYIKDSLNDVECVFMKIEYYPSDGEVGNSKSASITPISEFYEILTAFVEKNRVKSSSFQGLSDH